MSINRHPPVHRWTEVEDSPYTGGPIGLATELRNREKGLGTTIDSRRDLRSATPNPRRRRLTDPPPRSGNSVEVLVDGERVCAAIARELSGAHSQVHIAGWHLTPGFELTRDGDTATVRDILAGLAERVDVRVLLWAGPPVPAFQPTRTMVRAVRAQLTAGSRVECVLDSRERSMHCHHEKLVIVDDTVAFVGGVRPHLAGGRSMGQYCAPPSRRSRLARCRHEAARPDRR